MTSPETNNKCRYYLLSATAGLNPDPIAGNYGPGIPLADLPHPASCRISQIRKAPVSRISKLLPEIVPETQGQVGGYFTVSSNVPLVEQELFGDDTLKALSAVPPNAVK